jgi:hypothetical protein
LSPSGSQRLARNGRLSRPMRPAGVPENPYEKKYYRRYLGMLMQVHENNTFNPASHQKFPTMRIPKNPKQARDPKNIHYQKWDEATNSELNSLKEQGTFEYIDYVPPKELTIQSMMIYDVRFDPLGFVKKYKARLVGLGNQQTADTYLNTYADTLSTRSFNILMSVAAQEGLHLESIDVKTAFLYSYLKEDIYLRRPFGLTSRDMPEYVKLKKCLYGLKQAAYEWRSHVNGTLLDMGFTRCKADECVYTLQRTAEEYLLVGVYVDDILVAGSTTETLDWFNEEVKKRYTITVNRPLDSYLGMNISRDWEKKTITVNQPGYIDKIVERFGIADKMAGSALPDTPMKVISNFVKDMGSTASETLLTEQERKVYMEKVGSIMHATVHCRPDLSFCTSIAAQKLVKPCRGDMELVDRILSYMYATREHGLTFTGKGGVKLSMTVDASYAEHPDRKSHYGISLHVGDESGSVQTVSKKTKMTVLSSTEAEYIGMCEGAKIIAWARQFLDELGFPQSDPTVMYEDNKSAIHMVEQGNDKGRTKHIDVRYHYIREMVAEKMIRVEYLCTQDMIADMLTKPLTKKQFRKLCTKLMGSST